ncbi:MAG: chorismate mutase [Pseudobdellovibrio sp.]
MEKLRNQVDQIHDELFKLFIQRIRLTEKIWIEKIQSSVSFVDLNREFNLLHRHDQSQEFAQCPELQIAYHQFIQAMIDINKRYLTTYIEKQKNKADYAK